MKTELTLSSDIPSLKWQGWCCSSGLWSCSSSWFSPIKMPWAALRGQFSAGSGDLEAHSLPGVVWQSPTSRSLLKGCFFSNQVFSRYCRNGSQFPVMSLASE